jgi:hypothetical protein
MKRNICCLAVVLAVLLGSNLARADGDFYVIAGGRGGGHQDYQCALYH